MAYDFPASPSVGQVFQGWSWDGEKWLSTATTPNTSGVIAIKVFTASGSYTPSPNMTTCVIECVGGGGGGGGANSASATQVYQGGGGGSGGYSRTSATAAVIGAGQTITIGGGGNGGAVTPTNGTNGADTSVGALCIAKGGSGGLYGNAGQAGRGGAGGVSGTGDVIAAGTPGLGGFYNSAAVSSYTMGGGGGSSAFGGGGAVSAFGTTGGTGGNYGGGGAGGGAQAVMSTAGGNGAPGLVVITEYGMTALAAGAAQGTVRYDLAQGLTVNQMAQARQNTGVTKRNYIINGAMQISQENGATAGSATNYYPVDMFCFVSTMTGTFTVAQVASLTPGGSSNRIRATVTAADAAMTGAKYALLFTAVEGLRMADLKAGTANAKQVTIQFGVKAPAGTYGISVQNGPTSNRSYIAEYVIAAGEANTDVVKQVTLTLDTGGTWVNNNTAGMFVNFTLGVGPTGQNAANSWLAGGFFGTSNQYNWFSVNGNTFELFDVSITEGNVAPAFQVPDYTSELALCKRYYQQLGGPANSIMLQGYSVLGAGVACTIAYPVEMRAVPTVTLPTWTAVNLASSGAFPSTTGLGLYGAPTASGNISMGNTAGSFMKINARL